MSIKASPVPIEHRRFRTAASALPRPTGLRINNLTVCNTSDLRRMIRAGLRYAHAGNLDLHVDVIPEDDWCGAAEIGSSQGINGFQPGVWMLLGVPENRVDARRLAQVIEHECDHLVGLDHDAMPPLSELSVAWAADLSVRVNTHRRRRAPKR